jgi:hypothetical protein
LRYRDHLGILSSPAVVCAMINRGRATAPVSCPIRHHTDPKFYHQSLNVGSVHPPQTQGKVQSAVRLALSGMYLLQASARTGLIDCQMTSKVPVKFILPIMTGLER